MRSETIESFIYRLDAIIATFDQDVVLGKPTEKTEKTREARELLKEARLKLVEELEARGDKAEWRL